MPCFVLRSTSLHAYMFRSICFIPYAMFSYALCLSFFLCWCLGLHAHMLDIMSTAMPCLDLHVCMHVLCSYAYVHVSHMLVCLGLRSPMPLCYIYMLRCISICLHAHFHACMCRSVCFTCFDQCSLPCFMPSSMCLHASSHVYVFNPRPCLSCQVLL